MWHGVDATAHQPQALSVCEARAGEFERADDVWAWLECDTKPAVELEVGSEETAATCRRRNRRRPGRAVGLVLEEDELFVRCCDRAGAEQRLDKVRRSMGLDCRVAPSVQPLLPPYLTQLSGGGGVVSSTELE